METERPGSAPTSNPAVAPKNTIRINLGVIIESNEVMIPSLCYGKSTCSSRVNEKYSSPVDTTATAIMTIQLRSRKMSMSASA